MASSDLLVWIPRIAAGVFAVYLWRCCPRLLRGEPTWIQEQWGRPHVEGLTARFIGLACLLMGAGFAAFALFWRGPDVAP